MRPTKNNIEFVKEFNGKDHNPQTTFAVMLREGHRHELKDYSLCTLPKAVKRWMAAKGYETWYEDTDLITYVWK